MFPQNIQVKRLFWASELSFLQEDRRSNHNYSDILIFLTHQAENIKLILTPLAPYFYSWVFSLLNQVFTKTNGENAIIRSRSGRIMIESNTEKFFKWLDEMERMKGLSDRKVALRGEFSPSMLSTCRKEMRMPTSDLCLKIAIGLHTDPIDTLRKASYLPIPPNYDPEYEFTRAWYNELPNEQKIVIRTLILTLLENNKKK